MSAIPNSPPGTRYVSESPREILAAVAGAFRQIPERSLVVVGLVEGSRFGVSARIRLPAGLVDGGEVSGLDGGARDSEGVRDIARPTLARLRAETATRVLLIVVGDAEPRRGGGDTSRARLLTFARDAADEARAWGLDPGHPIVVDGDQIARLPESEFAAIGSLHESEFARRERAAGRPYALDADPALLISASARAMCERRWAPKAQRAPSRPQHENTEAQAADLVARLLRSGAGQSRWLGGSDERDLVSKCELLESALELTSTREGRDAVFAAIMGEMDGHPRPIAGVLEAVFETGLLRPNGRITPGGDLFFVTRRALALLEALADTPLDPTLGAGLVNYAAIHGLTAWFSGRFGECHAAATAILARDERHEMAQYLAQMVQRGLTPAWLGPELMRERPT